MTSPAPRWPRRLATALTVTGLMLVGVPAAYDVSARPARVPTIDAAATGLTPVSHRSEHPHRKIKKYRVKPGDTSAGIATRYHAWTAELIEMNHASMYHPGQVIRIPVVVRASRACTVHRHHHTHFRSGPDHGHHHAKGSTKGTGTKADKPTNKPAPKPHKKSHKKPSKKPHKQPHKKPEPHHAKPPRAHHHAAHGWAHPHASRALVRRVILKRARNLGVSPSLALAIAWQESGWQQRQVSYAGALGVMQVMPGTGQWMSSQVGRRLNLRNLHDNVTAGVALIKILRGQASLRYAVAGYYQGLWGVRQFGMYDSTRHYVANVLALKKRLKHGWNPA